MEEEEDEERERRRRGEEREGRRWKRKEVVRNVSFVMGAASSSHQGMLEINIWRSMVAGGF